MRATLANLNDCAVPFLSRAALTCASTILYYSVSWSKSFRKIMFVILRHEIVPSTTHTTSTPFPIDILIKLEVIMILTSKKDSFF